MKKIIILSVMVFAITSYAGAAPSFTPTVINDFQTFQGTSTHDLNSIKQQRFRYEEINDVKDLKEQKEKFNRKNSKNVLKDTRINDKSNRVPLTGEYKFVEDNGILKIEADDDQK